MAVMQRQDAALINVANFDRLYRVRQATPAGGHMLQAGGQDIHQIPKRTSGSRR